MAARAAGPAGAERRALDLSGRPTARLALGVDSGRYRLQGQWAPAQFLTGKLQRLTVPLVNIRGDATLKDRMLDGQLIAASPELRAVARGALDLAGNRFRGMRLGIDLLKPPALFPNMTGKSRAHGVDARRPVRDRRLFLPADLAARAVRRYRLRRPARRGARPPRAVADARADPPLARSAITGIGDVAGAMLANPTIEGWLTVTPKLVRGDGPASSPAPNGTASCRC